MSSPTDLIALPRRELDDMVRLADLLAAYARYGHRGVVQGYATFLLAELRTLAARPAMCAQCAADAEQDGLCATHLDEAQAQRQDDVLHAAGML